MFDINFEKIIRENTQYGAIFQTADAKAKKRNIAKIQNNKHGKYTGIELSRDFMQMIPFSQITMIELNWSDSPRNPQQEKYQEESLIRKYEITLKTRNL